MSYNDDRAILQRITWSNYAVPPLPGRVVKCIRSGCQSVCPKIKGWRKSVRSLWHCSSQCHIKIEQSKAKVTQRK